MRRRRTTSISSCSTFMRTRMRRRSASSLVSPGPLVPMPPPSRDSASLDSDQPRQQVLQLRQLDLQLAFARAGAPAKMSRISCVRSTTLRSSRLFSSRSCAGDSSLSKMTRSTSASARGVRQHLDLAAAEEGRRIGPGPILQHAQHHARARGVGEAAELFEGMFRVDPPRAAGDQTDERCPLHEHGTPCTH